MIDNKQHILIFVARRTFSFLTIASQIVSCHLDIEHNIEVVDESFFPSCHDNLSFTFYTLHTYQSSRYRDTVRDRDGDSQFMTGKSALSSIKSSTTASMKRIVLIVPVTQARTVEVPTLSVL